MEWLLLDQRLMANHSEMADWENIDKLRVHPLPNSSTKVLHRVSLIAQESSQLASAF